MNPTLLLSFDAVFLLLLTSTGLVLLRQARRQDRVAARVRMIHGQQPTPRTGGEAIAMRTAVTHAVAAIGQLILRSGLLSAGTRAEFEQTLATAGLRGANGLALFVGGKLLLVAGLPLLTFLLLPSGTLPGMLGKLAPAVAGLVGLLAPDWLIGRRRKRYQRRLEQGLPDALDMMVICAQAGLGLGAAIVRVAAELQGGRREVAEELALTANELQMNSDSRVALINLGTRTGVDGYKRLSGTLVQTMQYGTPLTDALRMLAAELRQDILTRYEARAARLPVLMTLPTVLFILPCVFLIAGGPAIIQVMKAFH